MLNFPQFGCLQGVKVICAGTSLAAPHGAEVLAENGAQVIHLEHPRSKDVCRGYAGGWLFALEHRNVFEMALDYMDDGLGTETFLELLKNTDVLIECNKGGTFAKHNLPDERLWEVNPRLIIIHASGFGQFGDPYYYKRASYDMIGQAFSGYTEFNGPNPGDRDMGKPVVCDYVTGQAVAMCSLMALYRREKTGVGESVDIAQYEALLRLSHYQATLGMTTGVQPDHYTGLDPNIAADLYYTCADGRNLCIFLAGGPVMARGGKLFGWENDPDFDGVAMVPKKGPFTEKYLNYIRDFCAKYPAAEVEKMCIENGVPCGPYMLYGDMPTHPHFVARQSFEKHYDPILKQEITAQAPTGHFKNNPQQIWRGSVGHGFDNEEILTDAGFTAEQIAELYAKGVVTKMDPDFTL